MALISKEPATIRDKKFKFLVDDSKEAPCLSLTHDLLERRPVVVSQSLQELKFGIPEDDFE